MAMKMDCLDSELKGDEWHEKARVILPHRNNDPHAQGCNSTLIKRDDGNLPWSSACVACHAMRQELPTFEGGEQQHNISVEFLE